MRDAGATRAETGLIVVWPNAWWSRDRVLELASERLTVIDVTEVRWSPERTLENYNRFYRARLHPPYRTSLVHDKGRDGPILVITVVDATPRYDVRHATSGEAIVSTAMFDIKAQVRAQIGGGPSIHAADNPADARRNLMMLLGRELPDPDTVTPWNGTVTVEHRDVIGADGWDTVDQLFRALDAAGTYVVLRNYEGLPDSLFRNGHNDIDLLTSSYRDMVAMANARSLVGVLPRHGGRFHVDIAGRAMLCDIRLVGDGYYPTEWERELLATRRRYGDLTWVPADHEYHQSLLYHALVHKPALSHEYRTRLDEMAGALGATHLVLGEDPSRPDRVLADVLARRGWTVTGPKDPTVFFNRRYAGSRAPHLMRLVDALHRRAYRLFMRCSRRPALYAVRAAKELLVTRMPSVRSVGRTARSLIAR